MILPLLLALILVTTLSVAHLSRTTFAAMLPTVLFGIALTLYLFGLADALEVGFFVVLASAALLGVLSAIQLGFRQWGASLRRQATPAMAVFLLFSVGSFVLSRNLHLSSWDEFSQWGATVKAVYLEGALAPYNPIQLAFPNYPPGLALFEFAVVKLGGGWSEANLFWAYQMLFGSMFIPFIGRLRWRSSARLILVLPIMALAPIVIFNSYSVVLIDPFLGLLFGYTLAVAVSGNARSRLVAVQLSIGLALLVLSKDTGAYFALVVLALYAWRLLREFHPGRSRERWGRFAARFLIPVGTVALSYASWKVLLAARHVTGPFSQPIDLGEALQGGRPYWPTVIHSFARALVTSPITQIHGVTLSQVDWFVIAALALIGLEFARRAVWGRVGSWAAPIVILVGSIVYSIGLLVLYLFTFVENEALGLASFARYLGAYWVAVVMFVSLGAIDLVVHADTLRPSRDLRRTPPALLAGVLWTVVLLLITPIVSFASFVHHPPSSVTAFAHKEAAHLASSIGRPISRKDRVWIISEGSDGFDYWVLRYELMPAQVNLGPWSLGPPTSPADIWSDNLTPAAWAAQLRDVDYVVVNTTSAVFQHRYAALFKDPSDLGNATIFSVIHQGTTVSLEPIGEPAQGR